MKLQSKALALAAGILWGASVFLMTLLIWAQGGGEHLRLLGKFYFGYTVSPGGAFLGLVYGFVDGAITGWLLAILYNAFVKGEGGSA